MKSRYLKSCFILLAFAGLVVLFVMNKTVSLKELREKIVSNPPGNLHMNRTRVKKDEDTFAKRRDHLLEVCNSDFVNKTGQTFQYVKSKYLMHDPKHNFVFCMVQKIGCTFWRRVFYSMTHKDISNMYSIDHYKVHDAHIPTLDHFDVIKARTILQSATTAMFVREPYERAFSGYLDKLHTLNAFYMKALGKHIIAMTRKNATAKSLSCGHDVTFTELIQYLVDQKRKGHLMNIDHHFSPIFTHCLPCDIKYDFIGKMETFDEDASYIMRKTNLFQNRSISMSSNASIVDEIYTKLKDALNAQKTLSHCMTLKEMYGRVWRTLQLRGLLNPDVPMPDYQNPSLDTMHREAVKASDQSRVSEYKHKGFVYMYKTVDRQLLLKFREYVLQDCKLFGYDDKPPDIFS